MASRGDRSGLRKRLLAVLPTLLVAAIAVSGFLYWLTAGGGAWRGSVEISEAHLIEPDTLELYVNSCNGAPQVREQRRNGATIELKVIAYSTPLRGGDDCLDAVVLSVDQPLTTVIDLHSGNTLDVSP